MLQLTFKQTDSELMVRAAATLLFSTLARHGVPQVAVSDLAQPPQYGFTASATHQPVGPKFVRITDLKDGRIDWQRVPFCECQEPRKYILYDNDILFARTGATTGKTHLVRDPERAVFASYLIRLRPKPDIEAGYLYAFFQSDNYWSQISEEKEGSAQPNVNGDKLSRLRIPAVPQEMQRAIAEVVRCVRRRQEGDSAEFPVLPAPLAEQRAILARIERLSLQIQEARRLRQESQRELDALGRSILKSDMRARLTPMRELVRLKAPDVAVRSQETYQFAGVYSFGRGVFRAQAKSGMEFAYPRLTRLRAGNFVYPKLMAWEGALGVVPIECDGLVVSTEFPVFDVIEDRVLPEVLDVHFRTPVVWPELSGASTGTNVRRRRLNPADFLNYEIPVPSKSVQETLRLVLNQTRPMRLLQVQSAQEIEAVLPSVLSIAFAGDL